MTQKTNRTSTYPIDERILHRWSPYAFTDEPITEEQLFTLFEAARWAPSSYNNQPWRFVYALRNTPDWQPFLNLLVPANQLWAQHTAALVIIASRTTFTYNDKPSITHAFDTGAAWQNFALQAHISGLAAHGMQGFDYQKAAELVRLPKDHAIHAMCAVGKPGNVHLMPAVLQEKNVPSERNPLHSSVFKGAFHE